jgi:hypothetical protein
VEIIQDTHVQTNLQIIQVEVIIIHQMGMDEIVVVIHILIDVVLIDTKAQTVLVAL